MVWSVTYPDLKILHVSPSFEDIFDLDSRELVNKNGLWYQYVHPDDVNIVQAAAKKRELEGEASAEYRILRPDGSIRRIREHSEITCDENNVPLRVRGIVTDVTEPKKIGKNLCESGKCFNAILENIQLVGLILDTKGNIVFCNDFLLGLTGWKKEEVLNKDWFELFLPAEIVHEIKNIFFKIVETEDIPSYNENAIVTKDGNRKIIAWNNAVFKDENGRISGVASVGEDITDQRIAEEKLRQSEELYRTTIETSMDGYSHLDMNGRYLEVNETYCSLLGYTRKELLGMRLNDVEVNESPEQTATRLLKIKENGMDRFETKLRTKEGRILDVEVSSTYSEKAGPGFFVFIRDITKRKQAEEKLKQREERLESLVDILRRKFNTVREFLDTALAESIKLTGSKIGYIYYYDEEKKEFSLNSWSGGVMEECAITDSHTICKLEKAGFWGEAVRQRKPVILNDFNVHHPLRKGFPEGHVELGRYMTIPVFRNDKIVAVVGVANKESEYSEDDILQITLLMDVVLEVVDRKRLKNIIEGTNAGTWEWNVQTGEAVFNDRWAQITGYTLEELAPVNYQTWADLIHPQDKKKTEKALERHFAGELEYYECELRLRHKKGGWVWVLDHGKVVQWSRDGKPLLMAGAFTDITERRQAEEKLAEETKRRKIFFEQSNDGIVVVTWNGEVLEANRKFADMLGYSLEEVLQLHVWDWATQWTQEETQKKYVDHRHKSSYRFETSHRRKDGSFFDVEISVNVSVVNGQKMHFCVCRDITERKQAEEEMKRYKQIVSSTPDLISLIDTNYRYSIVNDTYGRVSGKEEEELVGHAAAEFWGDDLFNNQIRDLYDRCLKGETVKYQKWFDFPKTGKCFADITYFPYINKKGEVDGIVINGRDITEIKMAGEALRESEEKLSLAMEASEFGFWDLDLKSGRLYANLTAYAMIGYEPEDLPENLEDLLLSIVHPDDKKLVFKAIESNRNTLDKMISIDFRVKHKSREWIWVSAKGKYFINTYSGKPHHFIGTLVNISPRVKAEKALLYAKLAADNSNRMMDEMLNNITHELRTPLASVIGFSDVLLEDTEKLSEPQKRYLCNINESGHRLHNIVNKLLDFVNVERGSLDSLDIRRVNIQELFPEIHNILSAKAEKKKITINTIIDRDFGVVAVDRQKLKEILYNLIENAIKFTDSGGSVKIEVKGSNDALLVSVYDTGIGIVKERFEEIFEPFVQIDGSSTRRYEGTGLGLALVKKLVEMHGGHIHVESEVRKGSNFTFTIPIDSGNC
ncbi:PAS domain S-box protein [Methanolobus vulcani]|uniref:histidine kinase n=1 Tax=Methanolobus vulcani TaxID=38026 RepID=A0A7Z8P1J1_9EURY|nr:PAS domain S-box protein [Methanolobus vulcani]TQD23897.1 PAS domain S-box protein [Methanolobus vulcani]